MSEPLSFRVDEWRRMPRGWVAIVKPRSEITEEASEEMFLNGLRPIVRLDMHDYKVLGVERFGCPWPKWMTLGIGILIEGEPKNRWDVSA